LGRWSGEAGLCEKRGDVSVAVRPLVVEDGVARVKVRRWSMSSVLSSSVKWSAAQDHEELLRLLVGLERESLLRPVRKT
jgi:hypothetical protein